MTNEKFCTVPWTASSLRCALESRGLGPRKGLGQHFLIDPNFCRFIVRAARLPPDACVLEIGCGPGLLTTHLAPACGRLVAVEIDPAMAALCRKAVGEARHVSVLEADILSLLDGNMEGWKDGSHASEVDPTLGPQPSHLPVFDPTRPLNIAGNLPYNLSVSILVKLLAWERPIPQILTVVQKEVGERLRARPGTEMYGPLSVVAQGFAEVERVRAVPRTVFWPAPRVESELVRLLCRRGSERGGALPRLHAVRAYRLLERLFRPRRKKIRNALAALGVPPDAVNAACARADVSPEARAEAAPPEALLRLVKAAPEAHPRA